VLPVARCIIEASPDHLCFINKIISVAGMTFGCKLFSIEENGYECNTCRRRALFEAEKKSSNYLDFYEEIDVPETCKLSGKTNFFP
jgi:hypothetical protein